MLLNWHYYSKIVPLSLKYSLMPHNDVIMVAIASQITSLTIVYSAVYSGSDERNHQSSASLAFVWGIHRGPVNSLHKWPVTWKMFPFDDVIMDIGVNCSVNSRNRTKYGRVKIYLGMYHLVLCKHCAEKLYRNIAWWTDAEVALTQISSLCHSNCSHLSLTNVCEPAKAPFPK